MREPILVFNTGSSSIKLLGRGDVMADLSEAGTRRQTDATKYLGLSEVMVDRVLAATWRIDTRRQLT